MSGYSFCISQLIRRADAARAAAYTPYSHFSVGAALLCKGAARAKAAPAASDVFSEHPCSSTGNTSTMEPVSENACDTIITGCNIENKAYGSSICAERTAIFRAIADGRREFLAIAIVGGPEGCPPLDYCAPCGACRQVLSEFAPPDFKVILAKSESDYQIFTLAQLLPEAFSFMRSK